MSVTPRDYQRKAADAILATWGEAPWYDGESDTYNSCVLNIPTSSGKTVVAGMVAVSVSGRGRFLYLADRDILCDQPMARFHQHFGITPALEKASDYADRTQPVVVGSVQTFYRDNRLESWPRDHFSYIFVDEAHRHVEQAKKIREYFHTAKSCGQTATAFRAKLKDLSDYYETVAFRLGMFDLIKEGFICPIQVLTLPVVIDISEVRKSQVFGEEDYNRDDLAEKIEPYYERVAELLQEHCKGRQIVAFLPLITASQKFVGICRDKGIAAEHIDHHFSHTEATATRRRFEEKQFQLISCSTLLSTGWDCPPCDTLLNLSPTNSAVMWHQKVGRIGRVLPGVIDGLETAEARRAAIKKSGKPFALIVDCLFHSEKFGIQGPADLIADNAEDEFDIQAELDERTGEFVDLMDLAGSVRKSREEKLREELAAAAKRREKLERQGLVDAQYWALVMHDHELANYVPTSHWHSLPVTDKQREYLIKQGIYPDSIQDRGHASALMESIWGRKKQGLAPARAVIALDERGTIGAHHFSDYQAYLVLQEDYPFPFGKHARESKTFREVPWSYWHWLAGQVDPWVREGFPIVWRRMQQKGLVK